MSIPNFLFKSAIFSAVFTLFLPTPTSAAFDPIKSTPTESIIFSCRIDGGGTASLLLNGQSGALTISIVNPKGPEIRRRLERPSQIVGSSSSGSSTIIIGKGQSGENRIYVDNNAAEPVRDAISIDANRHKYLCTLGAAKTYNIAMSSSNGHEILNIWSLSKYGVTAPIFEDSTTRESRLKAAALWKSWPK